MTKISVQITEGAPYQATVIPPVPVSVVAKPGWLCVEFSWSPMVVIQPCWWEYKFKIGSQAKDTTWTKLYANRFNRILTDAEIGLEGTHPLVHIWLRSSSLVAQSAEVEAYDYPRYLVGVDSVPSAYVTAAMLASAVVARMFTTSAKLGSELGTGSVTDTQLAVLTITAAKLAAAVTDRMFLTAAERTTALADIVLAKSTYTKITSEVGGFVAEHTVGSQAKVDARLSATEKSNLAGALGVSLAILSPTTDHVLISGTNGNISGAIITAVKTSLLLEKVENKTAAEIIATLALGTLPTGTVKTTNVLASINASAEGLLIDDDLLDNISPLKIIAGTTNVFDASGYLKTGVGVGSTLRTTTAIATVVGNDGRAKNLDLTSVAAGDLDDVADGTTRYAVTSAGQTGAERAGTAFTVDGDGNVVLNTGTVNFPTLAQVENSIMAPRVQVNDPVEYTPTPGGISVPTLVGTYHVLKNKGDTEVRVRYIARATDFSIPFVSATLLNELGSALSPAVTDHLHVDSNSYAAYEITLDFPTAADGTWYVLQVHAAETLAETIKVKSIRIWTQ